MLVWDVVLNEVSVIVRNSSKCSSSSLAPAQYRDSMEPLIHICFDRRMQTSSVSSPIPYWESTIVYKHHRYSIDPQCCSTVISFAVIRKLQVLKKNKEAYHSLCLLHRRTECQHFPGNVTGKMLRARTLAMYVSMRCMCCYVVQWSEFFFSCCASLPLACVQKSQQHEG